MKTIHILSVLLFLTMASCTQKPFEGTVYSKVSGLKEVETSEIIDGKEVEKVEEKRVTYTESTFFIKDKAAVFEMTMNGLGMVLYLDQKTNEFISRYIMQDGTNQVIRLSVDVLEGKSTDPNISATKTGNSKMIGTYLCFEYNMKILEEESGTLWAAPALQLDLTKIPLFNLPSDVIPQLLAPIKGVDGFVLAMKFIDEERSTDVEMTVTEKKIEENRFIIPESDKEGEIRKVEEEYAAKILKVEGDEAAIKKLSDELKEKIEAIKK